MENKTQVGMLTGTLCSEMPFIPRGHLRSVHRPPRSSDLAKPHIPAFVLGLGVTANPNTPTKKTNKQKKRLPPYQAAGPASPPKPVHPWLPGFCKGEEDDHLFPSDALCLCSGASIIRAVLLKFFQQVTPSHILNSHFHCH